MELDVTKPFSRKQALAAGLSPRELAGPRFVRLHRGIYIANGYKPALNAECGILMRHRKGLTYVRGRTAARLWGGIVPDDSSLYFGTDDDWGQSRKLVRATRAAEQPALTTAYGIKITTPEQTFWDLGTELDLVELVVLADAMVRRKSTTPERLVEFCLAHAHTGINPALHAAAYARRGVDSATESRARMLWMLAGLPAELETDIRLYNDAGDLVRRIDMGIKRVKFAFEYDGRHHVEMRTNVHGDIIRREGFDNDGWVLLLAINEDVFGRPDLLLARAVERLARCGIRARITSDEWRRYFPVRAQ